MDKVKNILNDIKSGWGKIDKQKRIRLVVLVALIVIFLFLVLFFTQRTEYKVLFSELEESDAGAIVEDLEGQGMEYKLEDDGTTILIDENEVDNYRIDLAINGPMPSTSTGFEIFDAGSMMATDEDRAIMYQRAISGELERAISSIESIEAGKVLLNVPENSVFQNPDYQKEATASVVLEMNNGQMPSAATTQGIAALVAGAVENLPQENVEILDTSGRLLSSTFGQGNNVNSDVVTEQQRIKNSIETDLEQQVLTLLSPLYGLENVQISVNTDLNFDAIEREEIIYGDESVRSQTENVTGSEALAQQIQGSLLDEDFVTEFEEGEGNESSTYEHSTNYELDTTTSRIVEAPGAIERMTASVIIMNNPTADNDEDALYQLVENALGINYERETEENPISSDTIQIEFFGTEEDDNEQLVIGDSAFLTDLLNWLTANWWIIVAGVVLLILIVILIRTLRRRTEEEYEDYEDIDLAFSDIVEPEVDVESEEIFETEIEEKMRQNQIANEKEDLIREQTKENPELAAELIKIWLKEND